MNSRWRAVVARGAGLTVCAPAGEAECEGCGPVPTSRAAGVAGAGGRAGPLRTGTKTVATSCCNVAFQQWVPTIKATIAERALRLLRHCSREGNSADVPFGSWWFFLCCILHESLIEPACYLPVRLLSAGPKRTDWGHVVESAHPSAAGIRQGRPAGARVHHRRQPTLTLGVPLSATIC